MNGVLHGRDAERSAVAALIAEARAGVGGVLVVRGPAGAGKTALLDGAIRESPGMRLLRVQGVVSESTLAFAGLHALLLPVLPLGGRLPQPQAAALRQAFGDETGTGVDRFLVYAATLSLLAEAAEAKPVLCVIDDAHWLDEASAQALLFAARRLHHEQIALLFAARDDGSGFDASGLPELALHGLPPSAARDLLTERAGLEVSADVAVRLHESTGGNALALTELPAALTPAQLAGRDPLPSTLPLTEGVERGFLDRVRRLPKPAQTWLLVAAAEGSGNVTTIHAAAAVLGVDSSALDHAERSGLVQVTASGLEFRHPLVRSAVYGAETASARRRAHGALAAVLTAGGDVDRCTWHRAAAALGPDEQIVTELETLARRATLRGGPAAAAAAFQRAAELSSDAESRVRRLVAAAAQARLAGHHAHASNLLEMAQPLTSDRLLLADIDLLRGAIELVAGSTAAAGQILVRAARAVADTDPARGLQLLVIAAQAASLAADTQTGAQISSIVARLSFGDGLQERFFGSLLVGSGHYLQGDLRAAVEPLRDAIRCAEAFDDSMLLTWAARAAYYLGDDTAAHGLDSRAVSAARAVGAVGDMLPPLQRLALTDIFLGNWPIAEANASEALRFAEETGQANMASLPGCWLSLLAAYKGDENDLVTRVEETQRALANHPMAIAQEALTWARAVGDACRGDSARALRRIAAVSSPGVALMAALDRIEIAVQAGHREKALEWLVELETFATVTGAAWAAARAAHCRALLSPPDAADEIFRAALDHHARSQRPFERARTELSYGEYLRRARRRVDARLHLRAALDTFEDLRAAPWRKRALQELRASGERARQRDQHALPQLTAQELQVARFVAQGLSNRDVAAQLFVSPRTIDFHLRNVFTKVGVSSRTQLAHASLE